MQTIDRSNCTWNCGFSRDIPGVSFLVCPHFKNRHRPFRRSASTCGSDLRGLHSFFYVAGLLAPGALAAQSIAISPSYAAIGVKQTQQYQATVTGLANTKVTWEVSGVKGGNAANGTITAAGLYTAPAKIPANGITITALGSDNKTSATVYIAVEPPGPPITSISPNPVRSELMPSPSPEPASARAPWRGPRTSISQPRSSIPLR